MGEKMSRITGEERRYRSHRYSRKDVVLVAGVLLFLIILFNFVKFFERELYFIFSADAFLTLHIFLEFSSIVMSFAIFAITYYTGGMSFSQMGATKDQAKKHHT